MHLSDPIYGDFSIQEPFLKELIQSAPVQRMNHIHQSGCNFLIDRKQTITRYDHCIGTMLLLRGLGASVQEQAAGLLHDVGHGAFSHVLDGVFKEFKHNFDAAHLEMIIQQSDIPAICEKHGVDWKQLLKKEKFPLLEQSIPLLCSDRVDYTLRDSTYFLPVEKVREWWKGLRVRNNQLVFSSPALAEEFALQYLQLDDLIWSSPRFSSASMVLADVLKEGLRLGVISREDLHSTDEQVLEKIKKNGNALMREKFSWLNHSFNVIIVPDAFDYRMFWKVRWVNPPVITSNGVIPLSLLSGNVKTAIEEHNRRIAKGLRVKIVVR